MKRKCTRRRLVVIVLLSLIAISGIVWFQTKEIELSRNSDPTGRYTAIVSYRRFQKPFATTPGNSSGHSGYIRIEDVAGRNYGKVTLPILWMAADMRWEEHGATLVGAGVWDFQAGTCLQWE